MDNFFFFLFRKKIERLVAETLPAQYADIGLPVFFELNTTEPFVSKVDFFKPYIGCERCKFTPLLTGNSKNNDVILSLLVNKLYGLTLTIKSLRTTGCRASFFVFTNDNTYKHICKLMKGISLQHLQFTCGVNFVIATRKRENFRNYDFIRNYVYYQFLAARRYVIDRVITFDIYDSIFQSDPFSADINFDGVGFTQDNVLLEKDSSPTSYQAFFHRLLNHPYDPQIHGNKNMVNSGILFGKAINIVDYYERIFFPPLMKWLSNTSIGLTNQQWTDQGYINVMMWSEWVPKKMANFVFYLKNDPFLSIFNLPEDEFVQTYLGNMTVQGSSQPASLIHQYDRKPILRDDVVKKCHGKLDYPETFMRFQKELDDFSFKW